MQQANTIAFQAELPLDRLHIHWKTPCTIVGLFMLGLVFAVTHHYYYNSLNDRSLQDFPQEWAVRIGTGLAFLTKSCLVASAAIAYQQYYWRILRMRSLSVQSIDDIMGLLADPTRFANHEPLQRAWSCVAIAVIIWYISMFFGMRDN